MLFYCNGLPSNFAILKLIPNFVEQEGVLRLKVVAEIIPVEPDAGNAVEGIFFSPS